MNGFTLAGLMDELEKLKTAGFMKDVGTRIVSTAKATPRWAQQQAQGGIRNMGGAVSAYANPLKALGVGAKQLKDSSKLYKGMTALSLYTGGRDALSKQDPTGQGRGRGQRVGAFLGDQAGNLIGAPYGLGGGIVAQTIGRRVGETAGKVADSLRGKKNPRFDSMGNQPTAAMPQIEMT